MHAIQLRAFGPPENLVYEVVDDPRPGAGQVRIKVAAAGVHLIDTVIRAGRQQGPAPLPRLPSIPGREVAGTVDALGDGVDASWLGCNVVAHLGAAPHAGGYAELAVTGVENLHLVPDGLTPEAAVAMIGTGRTALAILEVAQLAPDDVVLVTAAAGGIGSLLVQAARNVGATVVAAVGSAAKLSRAQAFGASVAVNYSSENWPEELRQALGDSSVSVALDGIGGVLGRQALELLRPGGRLIMFGFASGQPTPLTAMDLFARGLTASSAIGARIQNWPGGLRGLETQALTAAAENRLVPEVQCFPLSEAAAAHRALAGRATTGKVVLIP